MKTKKLVGWMVAAMLPVVVCFGQEQSQDQKFQSALNAISATVQNSPDRQVLVERSQKQTEEDQKVQQLMSQLQVELERVQTKAQE